MKQGIPEHIITVIDALLAPYGVSLDEIINGGVIEPQIYITPRQASLMSGCHAPKTIRDFALAHKFKSKRIGHPTRGRVMIERKSFAQWLNGLPDQ